MIRQLSICLLGGMILSGCATMSPLAPDYDRVESRLSSADVFARQSYMEARNAQIAARPNTIARWWTQFGDPVLDGLVEQGLSQNREIDAAVATLNIARANLSLSRSDYIPTDTQSASWQRNGSAETGGFGAPDQTLLSASVSALWEWDLFGRIARSIEVAEADLRQGEALLTDIQSLVIADIAETYQTLRGLEAQLSVVQDNIDTLESTRDLTIIIRDAGRGTDLDVERANEQLASTRAALSPLRLQIDAARYQLGVLTGQTPPEIFDVVSQARPLALISDRIPVGRPEDLLRLRPDVVAAELALVEANATIGLQRSQAFPVIGLFGSFGLTSDRVENIFDESARSFTIGPSLSFSAVDFIRNEDRVAAATAGAEAELANYELTVLRALAEAETALSAENEYQRQLEELREAKRAAAEAARLARIRFENGATTFLTVLDAERRSIDADNALALARTNTALAQVRVFRALRAGPIRQ